MNRRIRVPKVRVIDQDGNQLGVMATSDAQRRADDAGLDLVEVAPNAAPPVCKIVDYGKYKYEQTKRDKESKKAQHQIKVKEVKIKPNTDEHDLNFKLKHAREFLSKGFKVKVTCVFRGREMRHKDVGQRTITRFLEGVADIAITDTHPRMMGRMLSVVLSPQKKKTGTNNAKDEDKQVS